MLYGITGKAGAGKDTIASILANELNYTHISFAGPLKEALSVLGMPEPPREIKEHNYPGRDYSYRVAAQTLGTEWARKLDENFWINLAIQKLDELKGRSVCISDVRFDNEAQMIKDRGGYILKIVGRDYNVSNATHVSEAGVSGSLVDIEIPNRGSIEELKKSVLEMDYQLWLSLRDKF